MVPLATPPSSGGTSPTANGLDENQPCIVVAGAVPSCPKKKKKRKPKKPAKPKDPTAAQPTPNPPSNPPVDPGARPSVLCISRNKHWRYISSYHVRFDVSFRRSLFSRRFLISQGPWLQLPLELLESLLVLNLDPATLSASEERFPPPSSSPTSNLFSKVRERKSHLEQSPSSLLQPVHSSLDSPTPSFQLPSLDVRSSYPTSDRPGCLSQRHLDSQAYRRSRRTIRPCYLWSLCHRTRLSTWRVIRWRKWPLGSCPVSRSQSHGR